MIRQARFSCNKVWTKVLYHMKDVVAPVVSLGANDPSWNQEVANTIVGAGYWPACDAVNVGGGMDITSPTPTLDELKQYKAVLVYSDGGFADGETLGNNLADYVDAGYGVVSAVFEDEIVLGGRWQSGNYDPLNPAGQNEGAELTLGDVLISEHPIMAGVSGFDGGASSYHCTGDLRDGNQVIAKWSNGMPLIIERIGLAHGKVIFLNFYPPSNRSRDDFWLSTTDGAKILSNALKYVQAS